MLQIRKRLIPICILLLSISFTASAQNFNYNVTTQSNSFVFLTDSVSLNNKALWDDNSYKIPIGFHFTFAGIVFDSVIVRTNGTISFDRQSKYNFVSFFKNFMSDIDTSYQSNSPLSYKLSAPSDSTKILKIEFKNVSFIPDTGSARIHVNFQVWLTQQSNTIEFHMGASDDLVSTDSYLLGLINMYDPNVSQLGYLLQGGSATPSGVLLPSGSDLVRMTDKPVTGTTYKFIAN